MYENREGRKWEYRATELVAILILLGIALFGIILGRENKGLNQNVCLYNQNWTQKSEDDDKTIIYQNTIPEDIRPEMGIAFRTRIQEVKVYIDGKKIYSYPSQNYKGKTIPSFWNIVKLPEEYAGQEFEIRVTSPYDGFIKKTGTVYYGKIQDVQNYIYKKQLPVFLISLGIGILGAIFAVLSIVFFKYEHLESQRMLGFVLVFVSIWLCGESKMPMNWGNMLIWQHHTTMISLFLCPLFLMAYLEKRWQKEYGQRLRILFYIEIIIALCIFGLKIFGVFDFEELLFPVHILLIMTLILMAFIYMDDVIKKRGKIDWSELICFLLIPIAACIETVLFYINKSTTIGLYIRIALLIYAMEFIIKNGYYLYMNIAEKARLEKQLRESRIELMGSQIQPHFIYNTLNSIQALIRIDPDEAYRMIYNFSIYLRANLISIQEQQKIPFQDELSHIKAYMEIEKVRFDERLEVVYELEVTDFMVPPLSIQPIVENAVKHGICKKPEGGTVWIRTYKDKQGIVVEVQDDGVGFEVEKRLRNENLENVGFANMQYRVQEICHAQVNVFSKLGKGTIVSIRFPYTEK